MHFTAFGANHVELLFNPILIGLSPQFAVVIGQNNSFELFFTIHDQLKTALVPII